LYSQERDEENCSQQGDGVKNSANSWPVVAFQVLTPAGDMLGRGHA
jgi:hypothetical protein